MRRPAPASRSRAPPAARVDSDSARPERSSASSRARRAGRRAPGRYRERRTPCAPHRRARPGHRARRSPSGPPRHGHVALQLVAHGSRDLALGLRSRRSAQRDTGHAHAVHDGAALHDEVRRAGSRAAPRRRRSSAGRADGVRARGVDGHTAASPYVLSSHRRRSYQRSHVLLPRAPALHADNV